MSNSRYLGLVEFFEPLRLQEQIWQKVVAMGPQEGVILGFETKPVLTLGARASDEDLLISESEWRRWGYDIVRVDRGGQATLHNPGQLVIFPVLHMESDGVKQFTQRLISTTRTLLEKQGLTTVWDEHSPGLYADSGKVVSMGLRVRAHVATHGLAINVHNDLSAFNGIRVCGVKRAAMAKLNTSLSLAQLFAQWIEIWNSPTREKVDKPENLDEFIENQADVRL